MNFGYENEHESANFHHIFRHLFRDSKQHVLRLYYKIQMLVGSLGSAVDSVTKSDGQYAKMNPQIKEITKHQKKHPPINIVL